MRLIKEREHAGWMIHLFNTEGEIAYLFLAIQGLCAQIKFPSDWQDHRRVWVRLGFGFFRLGFSFPWNRIVLSAFRYSGSTYGFIFFGTGLHLYWGKRDGKCDDSMTILAMPWR